MNRRWRALALSLAVLAFFGVCRQAALTPQESLPALAPAEPAAPEEPAENPPEPESADEPGEELAEPADPAEPTELVVAAEPEEPESRISVGEAGKPAELVVVRKPPLTEEEWQLAGEVLAPQIEKICRDYSVMGMSLVVFDQNGPFYYQNYGWAVKETGQPAEKDTIYRIASISKAVTALLALDLAEEGKLDLHGDLTGIMGIPVIDPYCPKETITPWHLLTHTSGIVDSQTYLDAITATPIPPLGPVLERSYSGAVPGLWYSYSNLGMGMMTGVIEASTGRKFLDYTGKEIFAPMGIDAAYSYTDIRHKERVANIYSGGVLTANMPTWQNMSDRYTGLPLGQLYGLGHGDLFISAPDLCRFARIMAGCPQRGETVSLSPEYLRLLQEVQYQAGEGESAILRGLGTQITDYLVEGRRMVGHQGNAYGAICGMFVDPGDHTGFVFLNNGAWGGKDEAGLYYVNREIAQAVYGAFF